MAFRIGPLLQAAALAGLAVSVAVSSGCMAAGGGMASRAFSNMARNLGGGDPQLPDRPRPSPRSGGDFLSSADLYALYQTVLEVYVDPVEPRALISGALTGASRAGLEAGLFPLETAVFDTARIEFSGDPQLDWLQLQRIYDQFLRKLLPRVNISGIGQGAARGMLSALDDPSSTFLARGQAAQQPFADYIGVGIILAATGPSSPPVVREVTADSPAEAAGLKMGDAILAVDGRETDRMSLSQVVDAIRGAQGTQTLLTVRSPTGDVRELEVRRGVVRGSAVNSELRDGANYIRLRSLQEGTAAAVRSALQQSPGPTRGWVLDLRGNDRGSLQEAVNLASLFIGDQTIAFQEDRVRRRAPIRGLGRPLSPQQPTVILVDEGTGGAAEAFAAALHDYGVARIVGAPTAGKAARVTQVPLPDGSVAQITSHRLLSPSGSALHRVGLVPDEIVRASPEDWLAGRDIQFDRALQRLAG